MLRLLLLSLPVIAASASSLSELSFYHVLAARQSSQNLQTFTGALGGQAAPGITFSGDNSRPFSVGGSTFTDFASAAGRSCDNQSNLCANAANAQANKGSFTVNDCDKQKTDCKAAQSSAPVQNFAAASTAAASASAASGGQINIGADPSFPDFDLICDA